jgi:AcrR family transcriptional regulator
MPAEMMTAHVGALQEIARNRLSRGAEAALPGLMDEVARMMLSYRPPPEPLRLTTRSPAARPEDLDAHNHAERGLRAFAVVMAERGYAQTTMDEVIAKASMSATTFYANFAGKEDALMAAIDSAGAQIVAAVLPAFERSSNWLSGVRAGYGALFSFLATRPALAHLMAVGVYGAGLVATARRAKALEPLGALIEGRSPLRRSQPPSIALEVIAGANYGLMYRQVRNSGPESLPALAPICTYLTLAPFVGAEEAAKAANGDGSSRPSAAEADRLLLAKLLEILNKRKASAASMARELGVSVEEVREQIDNLKQAGLIILLEEPAEGAGASSELFYHLNTNYVDNNDWEQKALPERRAISEQVTRLVTSEIERAIAVGTYDARVDRHLSRVPVVLDEEGWHKLMEVHQQAFQTSISIQAESTERLKRSGGRGIPGSSVQTLFEVPESDPDASEHVLEHIQSKTGTSKGRPSGGERGVPDEGDGDT